eukprot:TRINITY_DN13053_c0_g1_i1.p1 TRINITY_DN13053_c0_g1~~TRINITY_DN13053_c0_g1_i1.p1  ORF type:complete len:273 (-),score=42.26 TRINITY_DN13053_c0_g1_i1:10-828(-)
MKFSSLLVILLFYLCSVSCVNKIRELKRCVAGLEDDLCRLHIDNLLPSQFSYGKLEIEKYTMLAEEIVRDNPKNWDEFILGTEVPIIVGPSEKYYVLDKHHYVLGLELSQISEKAKVVQCKIISDWSDLGENEFLLNAVESKAFWLYDNKGIEMIDPGYLPKHFNKMLYDPYRDLAAYVRSNDGYEKLGIPFQDFYWANYFRDLIPVPTTPAIPQYSDWCNIRPYDLKDCLPMDFSFHDWIYENIQTALKLAHNYNARDIPGYIPPKQQQDL